MKRAWISFLFLAVSVLGSDGQQQPEREKFDFDETQIGYSTPEELAGSFFLSVLKNEDVNKFFSPKEVFLYLLDQSESKNKEQMILTTQSQFHEFEKERNLNLRALHDNLIAHNMDVSNTKIDTIEYKIDDLPGHNGKFKSGDITVKFSSGSSKYSILLDDCGYIKGKWFIMTPYILWLGKESGNGSKQQ